MSAAYEGDGGGDYGYDLAHEVSSALEGIPRPRGAAPITVAGVSASFPPDLHGDLGYDSAHEVGS